MKTNINLNIKQKINIRGLVSKFNYIYEWIIITIGNNCGKFRLLLLYSIYFDYIWTYCTLLIIPMAARSYSSIVSNILCLLVLFLWIPIIIAIIISICGNHLFPHEYRIAFIFWTYYFSLYALMVHLNYLLVDPNEKYSSTLTVIYFYVYAL